MRLGFFTACVFSAPLRAAVLIWLACFSPGVFALIKRQLSPPSLPAAANDAVALPQPAPEAYVPSNAPGSMDAYRGRD